MKNRHKDGQKLADGKQQYEDGLAALFSLITNLITLRRVNRLSVSDLSRI